MLWLRSNLRPPYLSSHPCTSFVTNRLQENQETLASDSEELRVPCQTLKQVYVLYSLTVGVGQHSFCGVSLHARRPATRTLSHEQTKFNGQTTQLALHLTSTQSLVRQKVSTQSMSNETSNVRNCKQAPNNHPGHPGTTR